MNIQLLIDSIVRQTTVLVAHLATSGGARTPLADVAGQVFRELAEELHRQGVSRKVAADMFGMALRTYRRKIQRFNESRTVEGRSLWEAVHSFIGERKVVSRKDVLRRFHRDEEGTVRSVLQDLVESGLVYRAGVGQGVSYRVASHDDLEVLGDEDRDPEGLDTLVWGAVYRGVRVGRADLERLVPLPAKISRPTSFLVPTPEGTASIA